MHLIVLLSFLLFILTSNRISVFDRLQFLEKKLHSKCLFLLPQNSKSLPELKALVCGENFDQLQSSQYYISTGLIHLFVVSGAHLIVLKIIADFLLSLCGKFISAPVQKIIALTLLTIYAGMCEFNPPVMRALFLMYLNSELFFSKIFWPTHFRIFIAGLISLLFQPTWISSLSLQLSWLISLGGVFNFYFFQDIHPLLQNVFQSIWIYPTLIFFQIPSPFFIITNLLFSKLLDTFLFPFALLVGLIPFLICIFDPVIEFLKMVLGQSEMAFQPTELSQNPKLIFTNWVLIFVLHFLFHSAWVKQKRCREPR
jgi:ComEC/Rec2-related protein